MKQKSKVCETGKWAKSPCISTVFPFGALAPDGRCRGRQWHSRGQRFDPAYLHQKNHRFHLKSMVFLYFSACFVLGVFTLDNKWTTDLLNFFFLTAGRKKLWHLSKEKEQGANVFHARFVCVWDVMKTAGKFQRQCAGILLRI